MARTFTLPELVDARWVGYYSRTYEGLELVPGETVLQISPHEAHASDHWEIVDEKVRKHLDDEAAPTDSTDAEGDA